MSLSEDITSFFHGEVDDVAKTLEMYSRDASVFQIEPSVVVFPKDVEDIKHLVQYADRARKNGQAVSLTARGAGTDMSGGALTESVVIEMVKHFNRLKTLEGDSAVVEPGMYFRDFDKETMKHGLFFPSYPASRELCTVGGMVANNAGGEKTLLYGKTERYVKKLNVVLHDGNEYELTKLSKPELEQKMATQDFEGDLYRKMYELVTRNYDLLQKAKPDVTKNSSGYFLWNVYDPSDGSFDLTKLIVGSQGTLGIITEITFKLEKPKPASRLLVIFLKNLQDLSAITERVLKYQPESFESYDDNTFKLAIKFFPEIVHRIKGSLFRLGMSLIPEVWMLLKGGIPKLVLLAEFTGDTVQEADEKANAALRDLKTSLPHITMRVTQTNEETEQFWVIRRESFSLLRKHMRGLRTAPFIDDFAVRANRLPEFLPKLYAIMSRYPMIYTIAGHVGDGNFHIIPLMDLSKPETKTIITNLSKEVYDLVLSYKGTITAEHNDGLIRSPFIKQQYGPEVYKLFEETKRIFDPNNIFNPGKKVAADFEYALRHLDTRKG